MAKYYRNTTEQTCWKNEDATANVETIGQPGSTWKQIDCKFYPANITVKGDGTVSGSINGSRKMTFKVIRIDTVTKEPVELVTSTDSEQGQPDETKAPCNCQSGTKQTVKPDNTLIIVFFSIIAALLIIWGLYKLFTGKTVPVAQS